MTFSPFIFGTTRLGHDDIPDEAFIFYLNPLQRFASNELWDELVDRKIPIIAMRTVAGGNVHRLRDVPGAAWKPPPGRGCAAAIDAERWLAEQAG